MLRFEVKVAIDGAVSQSLCPLGANVLLDYAIFRCEGFGWALPRDLRCRGIRKSCAWCY